MKKLLISLTAFVLFTPQLKAYQCPNNNPYHKIINQTHTVSQDYVAGNLVVPNVSKASSGNIQKNHMEQTASQHLEVMFKEAKAQGIKLTLVSGYRDYKRQTQLYNNTVAQNGINQKASAKPGTSEHQSGLAVDVNSLYQSFGETKEGKWLVDNAHKYGFVIRYPKGKEHLTGYIYEPWHLRYVGEELATRLHKENKVMEELDYCCINYKETTLQVHNGIAPYTLYLHNINGTDYIALRNLTLLLDIILHPNQTVTRGDIELNIKEQLPQSFVVNGITYVPFNQLLKNLNYNVTYVDKVMTIQ